MAIFYVSMDELVPLRVFFTVILWQNRRESLESSDCQTYCSFAELANTYRMGYLSRSRFLSQKFCGILICSSNCYWHYQPFSVLKHEGLTTNRTFHITKSKMIHWWFATENNCYLLTVPWHCWLGGRKGIWLLKNWVMGCWRGYPSGARCRLAYGPADATATVSCFGKIQIGFTFLVPAHLGSPGQRAVKQVCVCVTNMGQPMFMA